MGKAQNEQTEPRTKNYNLSGNNNEESFGEGSFGKVLVDYNDGDNNIIACVKQNETSRILNITNGNNPKVSITLQSDEDPKTITETLLKSQDLNFIPGGNNDFDIYVRDNDDEFARTVLHISYNPYIQRFCIASRVAPQNSENPTLSCIFCKDLEEIHKAFDSLDIIDPNEKVLTENDPLRDKTKRILDNKFVLLCACLQQRQEKFIKNQLVKNISLNDIENIRLENEAQSALVITTIKANQNKQGANEEEQIAFIQQALIKGIDASGEEQETITGSKEKVPSLFEIVKNPEILHEYFRQRKIKPHLIISARKTWNDYVQDVIARISKEYFDRNPINFDKFYEECKKAKISDDKISTAIDAQVDIFLKQNNDTKQQTKSKAITNLEKQMPFKQPIFDDPDAASRLYYDIFTTGYSLVEKWFLKPKNTDAAAKKIHECGYNLDDTMPKPYEIMFTKNALEAMKKKRKGSTQFSTNAKDPNEKTIRQYMEEQNAQQPWYEKLFWKKAYDIAAIEDQLNNLNNGVHQDPISAASSLNPNNQNNTQKQENRKKLSFLQKITNRFTGTSSSQKKRAATLTIP